MQRYMMLDDQGPNVEKKNKDFYRTEHKLHVKSTVAQTLKITMYTWEPQFIASKQCATSNFSISLKDNVELSVPHFMFVDGA